MKTIEIYFLIIIIIIKLMIISNILMNCYQIVTWISISFILLYITLHFVSYFLRKPPLKLNKDSCVILVGGCTGIGRVMANQISKLYHSDIILIDRRTDLFESVSSQLKQNYSLCQCYYAELTNQQSVNNIISLMKQKKKKIDLLIYNAGILYPLRAWQHSSKEQMQVMQVNYFTPISIINGLFQQLRGSHIAIVSSITVFTPGGNYASSYIASKQAIYGYINSLRLEIKLKKQPISTSIACPYVINTDLVKGFKTSLDWIFPIQDKEDVGKYLISQFLKRKEIITFPKRVSLAFKILLFFPSFIFDWINNNLDHSDFSEIRQKHKKQKNVGV